MLSIKIDTRDKYFKRLGKMYNAENTNLNQKGKYHRTVDLLFD